MSVAPMSSADQVARVQAALREADMEGWLFFDFRGQNPIAMAMLGLGWTSRRSSRSQKTPSCGPSRT